MTVMLILLLFVRGDAVFAEVEADNLTDSINSIDPLAQLVQSILADGGVRYICR